MEYGDKLEASGKFLSELLNWSTADLSSQFGMKRGHIARFTNRSSACEEPLPVAYTLRTKRMTTTPRNNSSLRSEISSINSKKMLNISRNPTTDRSSGQSMSEIKIKDGYVLKGIVAAEPAEPRAWGCVQAPPIVEDVSPYSDIENISVQKLTPEYKIGMERLVAITPPMKASELWRDKPAVLLCIRRPG